MLYKVVRHPIYLGFILAFWAAPTMTVGHLVFAVATLGYIVVAIQLEERDLVREYGARYLAYRQEVRGLVPIPRSPASDSAVTGSAAPRVGGFRSSAGFRAACSGGDTGKCVTEAARHDSDRARSLSRRAPGSRTG